MANKSFTSEAAGMFNMSNIFDSVLLCWPYGSSRISEHVSSAKLYIKVDGWNTSDIFGGAWQNRDQILAKVYWLVETSSQDFVLKITWSEEGGGEKKLLTKIYL